MAAGRRQPPDEEVRKVNEFQVEHVSKLGPRMSDSQSSSSGSDAQSSSSSNSDSQ